MKQIIILCLLATLLWAVMFNPAITEQINFWILMTLSTGILAGSALFINAKRNIRIPPVKISHILIAIASGFLLYLFFFCGGFLAKTIFPFAKSQITSVYRNKEGVSLWTIALLLFLWIGPAEEIFWRGFVQNKISSRMGETKALAITTAVYTGVHIVTLNFMLIIAALVCGLFWGLLYKQFKSIWICIISHAVFDLTIFVLLPVG